jgi:hypothetical protein
MVDSNYTSSGLDWPWAVILLYSSKRDLKEFDLPLADGNYQQVPIDDKRFDSFNFTFKILLFLVPIEFLPL